MKTARLFSVLAALLVPMMTGSARAELPADRGGVSIRVTEPYGWERTRAHLVIYPIGRGSFLISRYTSFAGLYLGRLHAGRYMVNAHGFGGGFGSAEFVVTPGGTANVNVVLIGTAFTRLHYRRHLGLLHAQHHLLRDRVMIAVHQHLLLTRTVGNGATHILHGRTQPDVTEPPTGHTGVTIGGAGAAGGDEWERLTRVAEQPAITLPRSISHASMSPSGGVGSIRSAGVAPGPSHLGP